MANLPDETLTTIFNLQRRLFQIIDRAKAAEFNLVRQYGETEETLAELEQIDNAQERARTSYARLGRLLLLVAEYQPTANAATMNLLQYFSVKNIGCHCEGGTSAITYGKLS